MAKQTKLESNSVAIDQFRTNRQCYNDNGMIWTTYCKVTCEYGGIEINRTVEVCVRLERGVYVNIELRGSRMGDSGFDAVFGAKQATFAYKADNLIIHGKRNGGYYKVTIGERDEEYISTLE